MVIKVYPSSLRGKLLLPSSKSHFQRLLLGALLSKDETILKYKERSADVDAVLNLIDQLGASVYLEENLISIIGGFTPQSNIVNCGESGLASRMFLPTLALSIQDMTMAGKGSLLNRTQGDIVSPLFDMGVTALSNGSTLPIKIRGPLKAGRYEFSAQSSSQFLSGLLFAFPLCEGDTILQIENLKSIPYIDLSIEVLKEFGIEIFHTDYKEFRIAGNQIYRGGIKQVESDWSSAAFPLVGGILSGDVCLNGLNPLSSQADKKVLDVLPLHSFSQNQSFELAIRKTNVSAFEIDLNHAPDLFPVLAVLACFAEGTSILKGVKRLSNKESNREVSITTELAKLGAKIKVVGDEMHIQNSSLSGGCVSAHKDHRIAMALAIAALRANEPVIIEEAESVAKSYPTFWDDIKSLGANIEIIEE